LQNAIDRVRSTVVTVRKADVRCALDFANDAIAKFKFRPAARPTHTGPYNAAAR
jgi:hypothetical protein